MTRYVHDRISAAEAIRRLDGLSGDSLYAADQVVVGTLPPDVRAAYDRFVERARVARSWKPSRASVFAAQDAEAREQLGPAWSQGRKRGYVTWPAVVVEDETWRREDERS